MLKKGARLLLHPAVIAIAFALFGCWVSERLLLSQRDLAQTQGTQEGRTIMSAPGLKSSENIAIFPITSDDLKTVHEKLGLRGFAMQAALIKALEEAGARVTILDYDYSSPTANDGVLKSALAGLKSMHVTIANFGELTTGRNGEEVSIYPALTNVIPNSPLVTYGNEELLGNAPDPVTLYVALDLASQAEVPSLALSAVCQFQGVTERPEYVAEREVIEAGSLSISSTEEGIAHFQYPTSKSSVWDINLADFLLASLEERSRKVKGKLVIVGEDTPRDLHPTVFGTECGVRVWSYVVNSILANSSSKSALTNRQQSTWINILLGYGAAVLALWRRKFYRWILLPLYLAGSWYLPYMVLLKTGLLASNLSIFLSVLFSILAALPLVHLTQNLRASLAPPRAATSMFLDIKGSTELMTKLGASGYGDLFNKVLKACEDPLRAHSGILERPIGDAALMIFFADSSGRHADRAVACARAVLPKVQALGVDVGIGIESGVLSGRFVREGSTHVWSSFGEPINASQRLQDVSREMALPIAIGPGAASQLSGDSSVVFESHRTLRGFSNPIAVYTVNSN